MQISLTRRGEARSVAFVTPSVGAGERESSWVRAALAADTVAIYMAAGEAEAASALPPAELRTILGYADYDAEAKKFIVGT